MLSCTAPGPPINITVSSINATAVDVTWEKPAIHNGIIRRYTIMILFGLDEVVQIFTINHTENLVLTTTIYGLTPNANYTVNISAVTVEPGDAASLSFITPSCKCVILLMHFNVLF